MNNSKNCPISFCETMILSRRIMCAYHWKFVERADQMDIYSGILTIIPRVINDVETMFMPRNLQEQGRLV